MTWLPLALSLTRSVSEIGAIVAVAGLLAIALLSLLLFTQSREIRRLREWAGRAPERAAEQLRRAAVPAPAVRRVAPNAQAAPASSATAAPAPASPAAAAPAAAAPAAAAVAEGAGAQAGASTALAQPPTEQADVVAPASEGTGGGEAGEPLAPGSQTGKEAVFAHAAVAAHAAATAIPAPATAAAIGRANQAPAPAAAGVAAANVPPAVELPGEHAEIGARRIGEEEAGDAADAHAAGLAEGQPAAGAEPALSGVSVGAPQSDGAAGLVERPRLPPPPGDGSAHIDSSLPSEPLRADAEEAIDEESESEVFDYDSAAPYAARVVAPHRHGARDAGEPASDSHEDGLPDPSEFRFLREETRGARLGGRRAIVAAAFILALLVGVAVAALGGSSHHSGTGAATGSAQRARAAAGGSAAGASAGASPASLHLAVLNSTEISGLAHRLAAKLSEQGYKQAQALNGKPAGSFATSVVEYAPGYSAAAERVARTLAIEAGGVRPLEGATSQLAPGASVVVIATAAQASPEGGKTGASPTGAAPEGEAAGAPSAPEANAESGTGAGGQ
jgi:hypothetical protein